MFGVLLALVVDDWREQRTHDATVERVLQTVRTELRENRRGVADALPHHRVLAEELGGGGRRLGSIDLREHPLDLEHPDSLRAGLERFLNQAGQPTPSDFRVMRGPGDSYLAMMGGMPARLEVSGDTLTLYGEGNIQLRSASIRNTAWEVAQATQATAHMDHDVVTALSELYHLQRGYDRTVADILDILYRGGASILPALQDLIGYEEALLERYDRLLALVGE